MGSTSPDIDLITVSPFLSALAAGAAYILNDRLSSAFKASLIGGTCCFYFSDSLMFSILFGAFVRSKDFPSDLVTYIRIFLFLWLIVSPIYSRLKLQASDEDTIGKVIIGAVSIAAYKFTAACLQDPRILLYPFLLVLRNSGIFVILVTSIAGIAILTLFPAYFGIFPRKALFIACSFLFLKIHALIFEPILILISWGFGNYGVDLETEEAQVWRQKANTLPRYDYRLCPLDNEQCIRILVLQPKIGNTELKCQLLGVPIQSAPAFDAISYTWGGESMTEGIVVEDQNVQVPNDEDQTRKYWLPVTPIVSKLLWSRRSLFSCVYLWIDAICINQSDKEEKDQQLPLMRNIYERASRVVVWLGSRAETADVGNTRSLFFGLIAFGALPSLPLKLLSTVIGSFNASERHALASFFGHSWFSRVWIIQEVAVAKKVHVMYGAMILEWATVARAMRILTVDKTLMLRVLDLETPKSSSTIRQRTLCPSMTNAVAKMRNAVQAGMLPTLTQALVEFQYFNATNPRDRVFALLGITSDGPRLPDPHYEEPLVTTYTSVARFLLLEGNPWLILELSGSGYPRKVAGLPSWVPDFSSWHSGRRELARDPDDIARRYPMADKMLTDEPRIIKLDGIFFDRIEHLCSSAFPINALSPDGSGEETDLELVPDRLFRSYSEAKRLVRGVKHALSYRGDLDDALWRVILACSEDDEERQIIAGARQVYEREMESEPRNTTAAAITVARSVEGYIWTSTEGKKFCITKCGLMGLCPPGTQQGDLVCRFKDAPLPFVLRKKNKSDCYTLIGTCYVDGEKNIFRTERLEWTSILLE